MPRFLGYRGIRQRPDGTFTAEIRTGYDDRINLGVYPTAIDAARAHDAAAWRLRRRRRQLNFPNVWDAEEAAALVPMPRLSTRTDRSLHRRRALVGLVPEWEERVVADWYAANPREYATEEERWHTHEAERAERRA